MGIFLQLLEHIEGNTGKDAETIMTGCYAGAEPSSAGLAGDALVQLIEFAQTKGGS